MKLVIRRSTMVRTDIKLDLDKDWKKVKKAIEAIQDDGLFEGVDLSSKEAFIDEFVSGNISKSEFFDFLQNNEAGGKREPDEYGDENYELLLK